MTRSGMEALPALVIDVDTVARAAGRALDAAAHLATVARSLLPALDLGDAACGDGPGGAALARAHRDGADELARAWATVGQVLEGDADRLYRVAFAARATDSAAGGRLDALRCGRASTW